MFKKSITRIEDTLPYNFDRFKIINTCNPLFNLLCTICNLQAPEIFFPILTLIHKRLVTHVVSAFLEMPWWLSGGNSKYGFWQLMQRQLCFFLLLLLFCFLFCVFWFFLLGSTKCFS